MFPVTYEVVIVAMGINRDLVPLVCDMIGVKKWLPLPLAFRLNRFRSADYIVGRIKEPSGFYKLHASRRYYDELLDKKEEFGSPIVARWTYGYREAGDEFDGVYVPSLLLALRVSYVFYTRKYYEGRTSPYRTELYREAVPVHCFRKDGIERLRRNETAIVPPTGNILWVIYDWRSPEKVIRAPRPSDRWYHDARHGTGFGPPNRDN